MSANMGTVGWLYALAVVLASHQVAVECTSWAVKLDGAGGGREDLEAIAKRTASSLGLVNKGRVEPFADIFLFEIPLATSLGAGPGPTHVDQERDSDNNGITASRYTRSLTHRLERSLEVHRDVVWVGRQEPLRRVKRGGNEEEREGEEEFVDPSFGQQWHLVSYSNPPPPIRVQT